ncbi:PACE efflux transporter [Ideonella sp. 4Y16]|uniref:PACE efflux transporter n=1 Tax=Ideonella alba TaxID=2824118 RepID=UPI001B370854|nr:PACE efflux transporter [Ideonella alba]MBQ0945596.1 PACE efflux transporter [Ideonella alba]
MPLALTPAARRIVQAVLYEAIAITAVGPAMASLFDAPMASSLALALVLSSVALAWNWVFNGWFERWEARQAVKGRSWRRRLAHGIGFEGGLVVMLVPLMAWWLNTTLWAALLADLGIVAFFFVYAVAFTWAFDRVFGLPESARANPGNPHAEHA